MDHMEKRRIYMMKWPPRNWTSLEKKVDTWECSNLMMGPKELKGKYDYVCDTKSHKLHFDGSAWALGSPAGEGCHEFVFLKGEKPACKIGEICAACAAPPGDEVHSVFLSGGSCKVCSPAEQTA